MNTTPAERLQTLVVARIATTKVPPGSRELVKGLVRFASPERSPAAFADEIEAALGTLLAQGAVDGEGRVAREGELARRIGKHPPATWARVVDRFLPGLALGLLPDDAKGHARLAGRDAWAAAIVARGLGIWASGPPPSASAVCDALVWRKLGLAGRPKRTPPEVRGHFVQLELAAGAGAVDWQVRMLAARLIAAPRAELRALRDALVRRWIAGVDFGAPDFAGAVAAAARTAEAGVFGDRKVFIAAVWRGLRAPWAELTLDAFKQRLLDAHRAGHVSLARADLVSAMDPALVADSEAASGDARFHFVVREVP
jgi:hypothetical protein